MELQTAYGTVISIGPANTSASDQSAYEALSYTAIGKVEDGGQFGDTWNNTNFTDLASGRVQKLKTTRDAGDMALVVGLDEDDAGQIACEAALESTSDYAFKVVYLNGSTGSPSQGSTRYFRAKVMSFQENVGTVDNVLRANINLAINSAIVKVDAV